MYGFYNEEKLGALVPFNKTCQKHQLQAGPQKNVNKADQMPLLAGRMKHLSLLPWTWVRQQAVSCLAQAMHTCPELDLSIPSVKDMKKIELAFCFPAEFEFQNTAVFWLYDARSPRQNKTASKSICRHS
jgi:hypothetical protein